MEKSTVIAGAAVVGGLSLIYWLTRKEGQNAELRDADYESPFPGQSPPQDTTFYDQDLAGSDSMCGLPERQKFFHRPYGHWCYVPDPSSPFRDMEDAAHEAGQCERRLNAFYPSRWTEAQIDAAGKQVVC